MSLRDHVPWRQCIQDNQRDKYGKVHCQQSQSWDTMCNIVDGIWISVNCNQLNNEQFLFFPAFCFPFFYGIVNENDNVWTRHRGNKSLFRCSSSKSNKGQIQRQEEKGSLHGEQNMQTFSVPTNNTHPYIWHSKAFMCATCSPPQLTCILLYIWHHVLSQSRSDLAGRKRNNHWVNNYEDLQDMICLFTDYH